VWQYKLYNPIGLKTTDGETIDVIDAGILNHDAGPDFFNAKIKINGKLWAGMVEIHEKASDWKLHGHQTDKAYEGVVLHVVGEDNMKIKRMNGQFIPQMVMEVPESMKNRIQSLSENGGRIACGKYISDIHRLHIISWIEALTAERLQRKTSDLNALLEQYSYDWNEVFYISLCRSFGFGINNDALERMARSLPFSCILKHRYEHKQIEAMMFGQAGALEEEKPDEYYTMLKKEYSFLRSKFDLKQISSLSFKHLRTRPANFPYMRIAQIAAIFTKHTSLFSAMMEAENVEKIRELLSVEPSVYWKTHYHFDNASPEKDKRITPNSADIIVINTIVPMMMAYGKRKGERKYCDKALTLLQSIAPEKNSIVKAFDSMGIKSASAADSQALIQLKREYCEKKKCLYCRIGYQLLKNNNRYPL
jgi:hypothetical protein